MSEPAEATNGIENADAIETAPIENRRDALPA